MHAPFALARSWCEDAVTAFTKIVFSVILLACGFGLASLFGPPELADRFAGALRPQTTRPGSDALRPLDPLSLSDPAWTGYESAAFQPPAPRAPYQPVNPATIASATDHGVPAAEPWATQPESAVRSAGGRYVETDYAVAPAAWRESTAPAGWPKREPPTVDALPALEERPLLPGPSPARTPVANPLVTPITEFESHDWSRDRQPAFESSWNANRPPYAEPPYAKPPTAPASPARQEAPSNWSSQIPAEPTMAPVTPIGHTADPTFTETREPVRHIVGDGDTLARLAERYLHDASRAGEIFRANQSTLTHPELLPIGAELVIPPCGAHPSEAPQAAATAPNSTSLSDQAPFARLLGPRPVAPGSGFAGR